MGFKFTHGSIANVESMGRLEKMKGGESFFNLFTISI